MDIPFNRSVVEGRCLEYIQESVSAGQISGDRGFSRRCQSLLETVLGVTKSLVTTSCTHALETSAMLLNIEQGDEVIIPSFTFVSTANAFVLRGAKPVFCDIRNDTLNLDETQLNHLITDRTKAIVPVHYAGVGCEMDAISEVSQNRNLAVIEDNAHGLFGKYKGRWLGTFGEMATQSFHETKNITCGEGGALLINDLQYVERAEILREKGTDRSKFFRGEIDKYTWVDIGSSYVMSDVLAAFLFGQLEVWETIQAKRKRIWQTYNSGLEVWASANGFNQPFVPEHCEQAYHLYYLIAPSESVRDRFIKHLASSGVAAVFHYQPLHSSPMGKSFDCEIGDCPTSEDVSRRLVRLPFFNSLDSGDQDFVIDRILSFEV